MHLFYTREENKILSRSAASAHCISQDIPRQKAFGWRGDPGAESRRIRRRMGTRTRRQPGRGEEREGTGRSPLAGEGGGGGLRRIKISIKELTTTG